MELPDWVKKYKKVGFYITKKKDLYYLYEGHNIYNPETKKASRVTDRYIGRITEKDGLIYSRVLESELYIFNYGLEIYYLSIFSKAFQIPKALKDVESLIMIKAILVIIYGEASQFYYNNSYLSVKFGDMKMKTESEEIEKTITNAISVISKKKEKDEVIKPLKMLFLVKKLEIFQISHIYEEIKDTLKKLELKVEYGIK